MSVWESEYGRLRVTQTVEIVVDGARAIEIMTIFQRRRR